MKKLYIFTALFNTLKGLCAMAFTGLLGNICYFLIFRNANGDDLKGAAFRTSVFGIILFVFSIYLFVKMLNINVKSEKIINEEQAIKNKFRENGYELDYKPYFANMLKTRLWGYYLATALWQIPTIVNYAVVTSLPVKVTIYEYPMWLYEWNLQSIFTYEMLGSTWIVGFIAYMLLFILTTFFLFYRYYKQFLVKPSYMNEKNKM